MKISKFYYYFTYTLTIKADQDCLGKNYAKLIPKLQVFFETKFEILKHYFCLNQRVTAAFFAAAGHRLKYRENVNIRTLGAFSDV